MTYQRNISIVLLAGITLLLASCVGLAIRGGEAEGDVTAWPPAKSQKHRSISIVITCKPDKHLILVEPCDQNYKETFTNIYK